MGQARKTEPERGGGGGFTISMELFSHAGGISMLALSDMDRQQIRKLINFGGRR